MKESAYALANYVIIIEFSLVFLLIITCFILKIFVFFRKDYHKKNIVLLEKYLSTALPHKILEKKFPKKFYRLDILLPTIKKMGLEDTRATRIYNSLISEILLPLARKKILENDWETQLLAAQSFMLSPSKEDEKLIIPLAKNEHFLVNAEALKLGLKIESETIVKTVVLRMIKERWLTQSIHLSLFSEAPISTRIFIENLLGDSADPYARATCYNILMFYPAIKTDWDMKLDIQSNNVKLRIAAIRFFAYTHSAAAASTLIKLIKDKNWEIRFIALQQLAILKNKEHLDKIAICLKDSVWLVKINAAKALKAAGKEGAQILKQWAPELSEVPLDDKHIIPYPLW